MQQAPTKDLHQITGSVIGAVVGGVLGHQVGGGSGKKIATVAGAAGWRLRRQSHPEGACRIGPPSPPRSSGVKRFTTRTRSESATTCVIALERRRQGAHGS